jgi:hypothetical protein
MGVQFQVHPDTYIAASSFLTSYFSNMVMELLLLLLLLLWSRKELHPAHSNSTCCTDDEDIPEREKFTITIIGA